MTIMKPFGKTLVLLACTVLFAGGCRKSGNSGTKLRTESDSVAYILGMNIGRNLWQMDSTLNAEAVSEGIRDCFARREKLTAEEAQTFYLHYVNVARPERIREYEDRFLEEICRDNRSYARTKSGVTYTVEEVGDEKLTPKSDLDTVRIRYRALTVEGREFDSTYERGDTLRTALGDLPEGMRESLKLIGSGGKIDAYVPAALAYGAEGSEEFGIKPNETIYYEIELVELERPAKNAPRRETRRNSIEF